MKISRKYRFYFFLLILLIPLSSNADNFVVLGDAGTGSEGQYNVANAISTVCSSQGCDYALYAGDNFYPDGVSSSTDQQFIDKFESPYSSLTFPFYVTLGNHDYGEVPIDRDKAELQVSYSNSHPESKFKLPRRYYKVEKGDVDLFVIDSNSIFLGFDTLAQQVWLSLQLSLSTAKWKIVLGHHPYISNGEHGNAGNYEGLPGGIGSGILVKQFIEAVVCGHADMYISGHDHNLQWPKEACGTEFIVSGAGAKTTGLVNRNNNPTNFQYADSPGFIRVNTGGSDLFPTLTARFYSADVNGTPTELYSKTIEKTIQPPCPPKAPCPKLPSPTDPIPEPPAPPSPPCPPKGPCPTPEPPPSPVPSPPQPPVPAPPAPTPPVPTPSAPPEPPIPTPPAPPIPTPPAPPSPIPLPSPF